MLQILKILICTWNLKNLHLFQNSCLVRVLLVALVVILFSDWQSRIKFEKYLHETMQKYQKCTVGINFCKGVHVCESHFMQVFLRVEIIKHLQYCEKQTRVMYCILANTNCRHNDKTSGPDCQTYSLQATHEKQKLLTSLKHSTTPTDSVNTDTSYTILTLTAKVQR